MAAECSVCDGCGASVASTTEPAQVQPDGHCLFNAVLDQMTCCKVETAAVMENGQPTAHSHRSLRSLAASYLRVPPLGSQRITTACLAHRPDGCLTPIEPELSLQCRLGDGRAGRARRCFMPR